MTPLSTKNEQLEQRYVLARRWLSDLNFFRNELAFFDKMLERHIIFLEDDDCLAMLEAMKKGLHLFQTEHGTLYQQVADYLETIGLEEGEMLPGRLSITAFRHEPLHQKMALFVNEFRVYKQRLFGFVSELMAQHKSDENGPY